ncbi:hypothetical protein J7643_19875, partial [bacterium]|nr:hypothetical protein [bacterium]
MTNASKKALFALTLSVSAVAGCAKSPATTPPVPNDGAKVVDLDHVKNAGGEVLQPPPVCPQPGIWNADCRFIAFTACRQERIGQVVKEKKYFRPYKNANGGIDYREDGKYGTYEEYFDNDGKRKFREVLKVRSAGGLFLWDEALLDVYILNGALAGLNSNGTSIDGTNK